MTLKSTKEFNSVYRSAKSFHTKYFVIFYKPDTLKRVGFVASKKIGNAVKRNRAKRRLRALFVKYYDEIKPGIYIFVAKKDIININFDKLEFSFKRALQRIYKK